MQEVVPPYPSWRLHNVKICKNLFHIKKSSITSQELKAKFNEHREEHHRESFHLYTDGSKTDDGVGYAYVCHEVEYSRHIQAEASIFTAELLAIYDALSYAETVDNPSITIFSDSRSAIQALAKYLNKNPIVQLIQCRIAASHKQIELCWVPSHMGIQYNEKADENAKAIITNSDANLIQLPRSDLKNHIKHQVKNMWREKWENTQLNKYREITNSTQPLPHSCSENRHWSVTLSRLRIGHTLLTHKYLMDRDEPPFCEDCIIPLTVKHILEECPSLVDLRLKYFNSALITIKEILEGPYCSFGGPLYNFLSELELLTNI
jgi:kelch-like protein 2/3